MTRIRRVVFDSSTLISAALRRESPPRQALLEAFRFCDVCASAETLVEMAEVLGRGKFDHYLDQEQRQAFAAMLRRNVRLFAGQNSNMAEIVPPCRDPKDAKFLALALVSEADAIVSSDDDLLVLHPWRGIPILTPTEFLAAISGSRI
jgi:uncharacterized protein